MCVLVVSNVCRVANTSISNTKATSWFATDNKVQHSQEYKSLCESDDWRWNVCEGGFPDDDECVDLVDVDDEDVMSVLVIIDYKVALCSIIKDCEVSGVLQNIHKVTGR